MTSDPSQWDDFESLLLTEFRAILANFKCIESKLSLDTRKDFNGLLQYILNDRASFREVALREVGIESLNESNTLCTEGFDAEEFLKSILKSSDPLPSYSPEFFKFPLLLNNLPPYLFPSAIALCERYWNNRYPALKESFIIPFASQSQIPLSSNLASLLKRRLLKGKLAPFDDCVRLAKFMGLSPSDFSDGFFDSQLAALKDILSNYLQAENELHCVLQQSGCHCD